MKILESYKDMMMEFVNEVDDNKIIKYKKKDGEQGEMKAGSAKSMPKDHPAKIAWDKMQDDGDGEEKPKGQAAMGGGDFDRDSNRAGDDDADDMDRDARFAADAKDDDDTEISDANSGPIDRDDILDMLNNDSEIADKMGDDVYWDGMDLVSSKFDDDTIASIPDDANMTLGDLKKQIMDFEPEDDRGGSDKVDRVFSNEKDTEEEARKQAADSAEKISDKYGIESDIAGNDQGMSYINIGKGGDYEGDNQITVAANDFGDGSSTGGANKGIQYSIAANGPDAMGGPIVGKMFDTKEEMESALDKLLGNEKIKNALNNGESLEGMKDEIESIMNGKDETVTINGKKYKPIKESKQHILKENYDRFFGEK